MNIILEPESFDIIMIVDNREIQSTKDREYIQNRLTEYNIPVERRSLVIGDVIWIARHKIDKNELVLDYIVERKRKDDLVSSIKNGHLRDQKNRLAFSEIKNVILIFEDFSSPAVDKFNPKSIYTTKITTQTRDGFFVKETNSLDHTITYLTELHKAITEIYRTAHLRGITTTKTKFEESMHHLTTYRSFCTLNNKSKEMTLGDLFGRLLTKINGISITKAKCIVDRYGTPAGLIDEYTSLTSTEDRICMVSKHLDSKTINNNVSKLIYKTYY
jgi:crossover junction endonuclease MUS81